MEESICRLCDKKIDDYDVTFTPFHDGLLINRMRGVSTTFASAVREWGWGGNLKQLKTIVVNSFKPIFVHAECVNRVVMSEIDYIYKKGTSR